MYLNSTERKENKYEKKSSYYIRNLIRPQINVKRNINIIMKFSKNTLNKILNSKL